LKTAISIKVQPRARTQSVEEIGPGVYKVRVLSPPEKGEANRELLRLLADYLEVPPSRLKIVGGLKSRQKLISLE
jgi:uncharacterized protein (TIGR00251 family)